MQNNRIHIVLGALFGDEGKGVATQFLCEYSHKPIVVRSSGGHQVGHTVVHNNFKHVFSNFGSGTLLNVPTYWSHFCTVNPVGVKKEGDVLRKNGYNPEIYFDANAMITTPFDVYQNMKIESNRKNNRHGSVGVGFGATIQRNEDYYKLFVRDLKYPNIRDAKLKNIAQYYGFEFKNNMVESFIGECDDLVNKYQIVNDIDEIYFKYHFNDVIFEGSQGILLDMDYGFFPNVTRSNTTSKNAFSIIQNSRILRGINENTNISTYYVLRPYQTRHGNGFMTNENEPLDFIIENKQETNISNEYQGNFRKGILDLDLLQYAVECDKYHNSSSVKHLFLTCLDQINTEDKSIFVTKNKEKIEISYENISNLINFNYIRNYYCFSADGKKIKVL